MKTIAKIAGLGLPATGDGGLVQRACARAVTDGSRCRSLLDTAVPIIVNAIKPKSKTAGLGKFEGFVMHANIAQITVRAKGNDMSLETFTLSEQVATKMQAIVDKGGYQYGDKVTVYYDPTTKKALKIKGKPSKPI